MLVVPEEKKMLYEFGFGFSSEVVIVNIVGGGGCSARGETDYITLANFGKQDRRSNDVVD
jgi:hypothetical protein